MQRVSSRGLRSPYEPDYCMIDSRIRRDGLQTAPALGPRGDKTPSVSHKGIGGGKISNWLRVQSRKALRTLQMYDNDKDKGPLTLYSLKIPPLVRNRRQWYMYLISGWLKILLAAALLGVTIATFFCRDQEKANTLSDFLSSKTASQIAGFVNSFLFTTSGYLDLSVAFATPVSWESAILEESKDQGNKSWYGLLGPSFYRSRYAYRHRVQVLNNRCLWTVSMVINIMLAMPESTWRLSCVSNTDETGHTTTSCSPVSISQGILAWGSYIQIAGILCSQLTCHLWHGKIFTAYSILATGRTAIGAIILSISVRYITGRTEFTRGELPGYNGLPPEIQDQIALLFLLLIFNGLLGGTFAFGGSLVSLKVCWSRSKNWMLFDLILIATIGSILLATFVSNNMLMQIHGFLCEQEGLQSIFPSIGDVELQFLSDACDAVQFHFRINYQHWVTFSAVILATVQLILGLCILLLPDRFSPHEWNVADRLLINEQLNQASHLMIGEEDDDEDSVSSHYMVHGDDDNEHLHHS